MALPSISVNIGEGGLGRPLPGKDHVSSILFYTPNGTVTLPSGFGADRIKQVFSLKQAEDLGIVAGSVDFGVLQYHISEFFRMQPLGVLWIGIFEQLLTPTYVEIDLIQKEASGEIRQMGVYENIVFATSAVDLIQGVAASLRAEDQPLSMLYAADISAVADVATLTDLATLSDPLVSVVIGQDGSGRGAELFASTTDSITTLGTTLGTIALAKVSNSIAWVEQFNLQSGDELDVILFANGQSVKAQSESFLNTLNDKKYIFLRKFSNINLAGSYHNDSHTAVAQTSDFAQIENNRVIDKASRALLLAAAPQLNRPLLVNADGQISEATSAVFKNLSDGALDQMLLDAEISAFETIIDPTQNVLATSSIEITINIVPVGVARTITFTVGFKTSLTT